jgi:hypothetical protein
MTPSASSAWWLFLLPPLGVLLGAIVGAAAGIGGQLIGERYRRYTDRQMTARGLAGVIEATLLMTNRREYIPLFQGVLRQIEQGQTVKFDKLLDDASIDPITTKMLDRVGLLGHDLPARVAAFMYVLTSIRMDLVRFGRGEFDNNMPGAAKIIREDLALWEEFEPKARLLVRDLRNYANERFRFLWVWRVDPD